MRGGSVTTTPHRLGETTITECQESEKGKICSLETQVQVTLSNLEYVICLWLTDKEDNHLVNMEIKFEEVRCDWDTTILYHTFPTDL